MILVDTGPFVALFDPQDAEHGRCKEILSGVRDTLFTTTPALTEAFHLLTPNSVGADRLRDFILEGGVSMWFMDQTATARAFELMEQYGDHPMDLADASLIVAAESLRITKVFTLDLADFRRYRIRRGHRHVKVEILE
ncbi:MAG: PIN domain-containing protein [Nitrospira sp.]|nr:MAG: PIN domain-containing protein [Nitrospira sp.]